MRNRLSGTPKKYHRRIRHALSIYTTINYAPSTTEECINVTRLSSVAIDNSLYGRRPDCGRSVPSRSSAQIWWRVCWFMRRVRVSKSANLIYCTSSGEDERNGNRVESDMDGNEQAVFDSEWIGARLLRDRSCIPVDVCTTMAGRYRVAKGEGSPYIGADSNIHTRYDNRIPTLRLIVCHVHYYHMGLHKYGTDIWFSVAQNKYWYEVVRRTVISARTNTIINTIHGQCHTVHHSICII